MISRWDQGRETVKLFLRDGTLQEVPPNRDQADRLLETAHAHLRSAAAIAEDDPDGAYAMCYDAARKALTAVLANQGLRPRSGAGAHAKLIDTVMAQLDPPLGSIIKPVDRMRIRRNRVEYPSDEVAPVDSTEVSETIPKVEKVLQTTRTVLDQMPAWTN
ncbi:MAG: HEPN domain-containing protein [Nocardioidaceae bacterium]